MPPIHTKTAVYIKISCPSLDSFEIMNIKSEMTNIVAKTIIMCGNENNVIIFFPTLSLF